MRIAVLGSGGIGGYYGARLAGASTCWSTTATIELKINFLKPVGTAKLRAIGRLVKRGKTTGFVECDITDEQQSLVARASSTCITLRGEQAHGR